MERGALDVEDKAKFITHGFHGLTRIGTGESRGMIHEDLSRSIIGASMGVLNGLKPGLSEKAYENALVIELSERGHGVEQQRRFDVFYHGIKVDTLVPDLIVDGKVIVDPKVVEEFNRTHEAQMIGYMAISGLSLALLLNFKHADLRWKRMVK